MNKIGTLPDDMYNRITKDGKLDAALRDFLGIPQTNKMRIGDTMCMVGQPSNTKDVFKYTQNGKNIYYIVINPVDDKRAFCYSIHPC